MALPATRVQFKDYCLRKLGSGAIDINVTETQIEDRIDEAIEHFHEYHDEGTERVYVEHQITQADIDNQYFQLPSTIIGVSGYLQRQSSVSSFYNVEYQFMQENIHDIANSEMRYYVIAQKHLSMIEFNFNNMPSIRYNKSVNKVYIDESWRKMVVDQYIVFDAFRVVDPETYTLVWRNRWLRDYTTALIKLQWGQNLAKFDGVQVIGGLTFNATRMIDEANQEIERLEEQVKNLESVPLGIFIG